MSNDYLAEFRKIAVECSEDDCIEILEDCDESAIRQIYQSRLDQLSKLRIEVDHYEDVFFGRRAQS